MRELKWTKHSDLAIKKTPTVRREEYLDYMTFQSNERPLFTEIFGPIIGLKEEWEEQGATPAELEPRVSQQFPDSPSSVRLDGTSLFTSASFTGRRGRRFVRSCSPSAISRRAWATRRNGRMRPRTNNHRAPNPSRKQPRATKTAFQNALARL